MGKLETAAKTFGGMSPLGVASCLFLSAGAFFIFASNKQIAKHSAENFRNNMHLLYENPQDWSCFYSAKQYREECDQLNRRRGLEYMDGICDRLEKKLTKCRAELYREISTLAPYAMDPPLELDELPYWVRQNKRN
ncbi:hypothetical protein BEWA_032440 [Theileria equi strain WA]|uniref:Uncharacterized protein n=1 Tax=Theileria equi strain WA TaxID=1537102 RepID=L0AZH9_THEEQ|nr:hypothetical protein BEWA_032440 [Theileria equi strain WA]AFZ80391.1 hypothetical protein BEWA_032440 [Theileria equi strain WA]|eukprot:XP_004830057.1 hypothetical protein BEWA_032440 [Theileria equi strain WA]